MFTVVYFVQLRIAKVKTTFCLARTAPCFIGIGECRILIWPAQVSGGLSAAVVLLEWLSLTIAPLGSAEWPHAEAAAAYDRISPFSAGPY